MSTNAIAAENYAADDDDPYHLTPEGIREPPVGWRHSLQHLGPGLILSASIVGSGELIATTALGAQAGFAMLWMVIFSTLVKVAVQVELARWTISTGQPALTGYNKVPPRIGPVGWINLLWVADGAVQDPSDRRHRRRNRRGVQHSDADRRRSVRRHLARDLDDIVAGAASRCSIPTVTA